MRRARFARPVGRTQRKESAQPSGLAGALQSGVVAEHTFEPSAFDPDFGVPDFEQNWSQAKLPGWALGAAGGVAPKPIQAALEVKEPGDPLEDEADRVADEVLGESTGTGAHGGELDAGRNAPKSLFARMERRFDDDLGDVRLHRDGNADALAESMSARAFTTGNDIYFREHEFRPETPSGQHLIAHELTHVVQQRRGLQSVDGGAAVPSASPTQGVVQREPDPTAKRKRICYESGSAPDLKPGDCNPREPENCPTYEKWLASFENLKTFSSRDNAPGAKPKGFSVLGVRATRPVDKKKVPEAEQPPSPIAPTVADRFIDHPTDTWVRTCLPDNLRETAYRLPSDCADIAVILRHVWLSAHHRTEEFGGWTCGSKAGEAASSRVGNVIGQVYSGNAESMVNAYADTRGRPLQKLRGELENLLHPGDVLVWEHHSGGIGTARTGGHVMTIVSVERDPGTKKVTAIEVVQGNQPIFEEQANAIRDFVGKGAPPAAVLRDAPGRRIETNRLLEQSLKDDPVPQGKNQPDKPVWTWYDGHTTLVAAGPPAAAPRPPMARPQKGKGTPERTIDDWLPALKTVSGESLQPTLEAALLELRATIEGGASVSDSQAQELGKVVGDRLFARAKRAGDLGDESHFRPLKRLQAVIDGIGDPNGFKELAPAARTAGTLRAIEVFRVFGLIERAFSLAARGASSLSFARSSTSSQELVKVLVTGFDPFSNKKPVPAGTVNPSAAAALALDGTVVKNGSTVAAVEGAVLPVDYDEFAAGIVESTLRPLLKDRSVDAVLTVSLDPNLKATDPVEFERFVVGVHKVEKDGESVIKAVPASTGGTAGAAIAETTAPIESIAQATEDPGKKGQDEIRKPTIGNGVTFEFSSPRAAKKALKALGLPAQNSARITISDPTAVRRIVNTMQRKGDGIEFRAGRETFQAKVVEGPGGNFLSNEVSFRVLRLLAESGRADVPSFHTHVPPVTDGALPQDTSSPAARKTRTGAIKSAMEKRATLIATLRRMIGVVAEQIAARKKPKK